MHAKVDIRMQRLLTCLSLDGGVTLVEAIAAALRTSPDVRNIVHPTATAPARNRSSRKGRRRDKTVVQTKVGIDLADLPSVCTAKETYLRASYCPLQFPDYSEVLGKCKAGKLKKSGT